ncbi:DEAD/DEAH box helicase [Niallia sp. Sow4_A1]|jgi:ATP-dependent RNA helicase DeaD|uniref:DEAD/DEAH box helicase n=1 Tax=Niallia hominis TaxID=3133173 RepID=A0ABV1F4W9_9BACI|nr:MULTISPECIES: DEAD/DEAH box helicase [Bacillaceae]MCF2650208.1 DEAD/DEAH box helicase [Niallia circulans]MCM3362228.1 DEAD/DEAH box helicase [Niallia sp. MER TA 168]CAI9394519.1 DEAD-box ATP-dependent RNA helicase CshE [Bacillus sp. T2.9-1]
MQSFTDLGLSSSTIEKLKKQGIKQPTPIQAKVIPPLLKGGDLIAQAQTGTGKTFAFVLPILEKLDTDAKHIQTLILTPTRELAIQITDEIMKMKQEAIKVLAVYGGQDVDKQLKVLQKDVSIVVATPGRLIDHIKRGTVDLSKISYFVLDEADQMLHIGFLDEISYIMRHIPKSRQTMLFSATISKEVEKLAKKYTKNAEYFTVEAKQGPAKTVKQVSIHTTDRAKQGTLMTLVKEANPYMAVIFCRTKRRVTKLYEVLLANKFSCGQLHGDLSQTKREQVMKAFRDGKFQLLIATDVAARGLDIDGITHVYNYDIPQDAESYVHRIGRTGRAGTEGYAVTFYSSDDRDLLDTIEEQLAIKIEKIQQPKKTDKNKKELETKPQVKKDKKQGSPKNNRETSRPSRSDRQSNDNKRKRFSESNKNSSTFQSPAKKRTKPKKRAGKR